MKFHNCIIINFVTDARTDGPAESNMPLQLFQSLGHRSATRKTYEKTIWLKPAILVLSLQKREACIFPFPHEYISNFFPMLACVKIFVLVGKFIHMGSLPGLNQ